MSEFRLSTHVLGLPPCPESGAGVHRWIMCEANRSAHQCVSPDDAEHITTCMMTRHPRPSSEVSSAISKAYRERRVSNDWVQQTSKAFARGPVQTIQSVPLLKWPKIDLERRREIIDAIGRKLVDLWESSLIRFADGDSHTEEIVSLLFPGNPFLCCGKTNSNFDTRPRRQWQGRLSDSQFIVPSPMTSRTGLTQAGRVSRHSLENTGPRRLLVIEQDNGTIEHLARSSAARRK